ncbi:MAG: histidine phosphatase family protein [Vulcanimicrobiaceae bacterium]
MSGLELIVVRHGRTAWNLDGRFQGHTDMPLDNAGRAQARRLADALRAEPFDCVVASDLARAFETAKIIVRERDLEIQPDARWREMAFGAWEGLTWEQIVARQPALRDARAHEALPPDGESFAQLCERVRAALDDLQASGAGCALVATHAGPLHALLRVALGANEAEALRVKFLPASITRLQFTSTNARLIALNQSVSG